MRPLLLLLLLAQTGTAQARPDSGRVRSTRPVLVTAGVLFTAAALDIEMTSHCIRRYVGCTEMNGFAKPLFGDDGRRLPAYAIATVGYGYLMLASNHWRQQGRRYWWVAPVALSVAHASYAAKGVYDMRRGQRK